MRPQLYPIKPKHKTMAMPMGIVQCVITPLVALALFHPALAQDSANNQSSDEQKLREEKHFLECLAFVYRPALWISYNEALYFVPKTDAQADQIEALKAARGRYQVFTDRKQRHDLTAQVLAESGINERWREKILLPYSATNQNLTTTLQKPLRTLTRF